MRRLAIFQVPSPGPVFSCFVIGEMAIQTSLEEQLRDFSAISVGHPVRCLEIATAQGSTSMYLPYPFLSGQSVVSFNLAGLISVPFVVTPESHLAVFEAYDKVLTEMRATKAGLVSLK